jgi:6-pyruvoyl-tetrahydropterin synthase
MYSVTVRSHMMIAHSFTGAGFGPARQLHGATYVIDVEFRRSRLDADNLVIDMGRATAAVNAAVAQFNYRNLDELPAFAGKNTTTEFLARVLFDHLADAIHRGELGESARMLEAMRVTLHESHVASAAFEERLAGASA